MTGYMTEKKAKQAGFTHYGSYYGIPCWIAPDADFMVATKWAPLEYVMSAAHVIEGLLRSVFFPEDAPVFQFLIKGEIP